MKMMMEPKYHCALTRMMTWSPYNLELPEQHFAKPSKERNHRLPERQLLNSRLCPSQLFQQNRCNPEPRQDWKDAVQDRGHRVPRCRDKSAGLTSPQRMDPERTCQNRTHPQHRMDQHRPTPRQLRQPQQQRPATAKDKNEEPQTKQMTPGQAVVEKLPKSCTMEELTTLIKPRARITVSGAPHAGSRSRVGARCTGTYEDLRISGKEPPQARDSGGVSP